MSLKGGTWPCLGDSFIVGHETWIQKGESEEPHSRRFPGFRTADAGRDRAVCRMASVFPYESAGAAEETPSTQQVLDTRGPAATDGDSFENMTPPRPRRFSIRQTARVLDLTQSFMKSIAVVNEPDEMHADVQKRNRLIFQPNSRLLARFDAFRVLLAFYSVVATPLLIVFPATRYTGYVAVEALIDAIFVIGVVVRLRTAFVLRGEFIYDSKVVALHCTIQRDLNNSVSPRACTSTAIAHAACGHDSRRHSRSQGVVCLRFAGCPSAGSDRHSHLPYQWRILVNP